MRLSAEILLVVTLPLMALWLRGQSFMISAIILSSLAIGLVLMLSVIHHHERGKLQPTKLAEYVVLTLIVLGIYLFLVY